MTTEPKPLNKLEVWISERAAPIFAVVAVLIVFGAGAFFWTYQKQSDTADRVKVIAPQVTRINKAICDERSLESEARARGCAERIRVGLVNCRRYDRCRAAFLAVLATPAETTTSPPSSTTATTTAPSSEGGGAQSPSTAGQQPGPAAGGVGQGQGQEEGPKSPETPPDAESPPPGPGHPEGPERPPAAPVEPPPAPPTSGVDVEVCIPGLTCAGVEVGLDPKGLLP